jgi:hypothetical protein
VLVPADGRGASLCKSRADGVGADGRFGVDETGSEGDAIEVDLQSRIGDTPFEHLGPVVGEDHACPGGNEVVGELVEDGTGGPEQERVGVDVGIMRDLEPVGSEPGPGRALPRHCDFRAHKLRSVPSGEDDGQGIAQALGTITRTHARSSPRAG